MDPSHPPADTRYGFLPENEMTVHRLSFYAGFSLGVVNCQHPTMIYWEP
jgi:hypothetical protein